MTGTVVRVNQARGFAFVRADVNKSGARSADAFLHATELTNFTELVEGVSRVNYNIIETERGFRAANVTLIS